MSIVEQLAHAEFLLQGAHKERVNNHEISADPLSVYMTKKRKMTEVMAQFDCQLCTSFTEDVEVS